MGNMSLENTIKLKYAQGIGFEEIDMNFPSDEEFDIPGGWEKCYEYGVRVGDSFVEAELVVYHRSGQYILILTRGESYGESFLAEGRVNLMSLRLAIAPLLLINLSEQLARGIELGEKAFRAWHKHPADRPCPECDPDGYRREQEFAAEDRVRLARAQSEAKARRTAAPRKVGQA